MTTPQAFKTLKELSTRIHTYGSILTLLHWDQETYMPKGGIAPRSHQIALLSELAHEEKISPKFKNALDKLIHFPSEKLKIKGLSKSQFICVREWKRDYVRATKLSPEFVKEYSQVTSEATQVWATAKQQDNFGLFAPFLQKIIGLARKKAEMCGFEDHPYDALLEAYEPCVTTKRLETIFSKLKKELTGLLKKIEKGKETDSHFLKAKISDKVQWKMGEELLSILPMDKNYTRLDITSHPFSLALHPHDSRITTRLIPNNFMSNLFSILHEAGHSFYEMGLPAAHFGTPLAETVSLSIHESQSRFWETRIGRSLPFWEFFYPKLQKQLTSLKRVPLEKFYHAINQVAPSFIRVEADEVTYGLHVILRYEIEKELISGKLEVTDLPDAWNAKMKELLGITPPNHRLGCLQDIHWSLGDFGYFPTYALGTMLASQFFSVFEKKHPNWEEEVAQGEISFVRDWLKENIHKLGRTYNTEDLAKHVTGKGISETAHCTYLKKKYQAIYDL